MAVLTSRGSRFEDIYEGPVERDPGCEKCGRSIVTARGEEIAPYFCDSCEDSFALLQRAGKLSMNGWTLEVIKLEDEL